MVSGAMSMGMDMGGASRHLEVKICSRATGKVLGSERPSIELVDRTARGRPVAVPVAVMYGLDEGPSDLHYGNNVELPPGHAFTVTVRVGGERAVFRLRMPKSA